MTKIVVLFGQPKDPKLFDEQYWKDHVPIAKAMPGLKKYTVHKIVGAPRGEPAYYQVVELEFENMDSLKKAGVSAIFQPGTAMDDIVNFIRGNVKPRGVPTAG